jgi:diguanylate cyclase (GGDEF)-like protein
VLADLDVLLAQVRKRTGRLALTNRQLSQHVRRLEDAIQRLQRHNGRIKRLALTDALTGLPNRRAIEGVARHEISRRQRHPQPLTLALIDADHFKAINQRHLLPGGDHALVGLANALQMSLRASDRVGRVGGEEFLLVAPETDVAGARSLGERLRSSVERKTIRYRGRKIRLTVSIGLAVAVAGSRASFETLKGAAAEALAEAKAKGRNRCVVRSVGRGS